MTYRETIEFLYGIRLFGQKLGLETMTELLRRLDNPHHALRFLHVAGTNGKGSVAAMCHAVLNAAGYRAGLYTSPHLVSFCERFQIAGTPIAEADVVRHIEALRPVLDAFNSPASPLRPPTFFEVVTAMALNYFRERNVDVVVWETGLGGRLDATNVVTPLVSVITNIAFDHTEFLGDTYAKIADQECGMLKPGVPLVTASASEEALAILRQRTAERACPLTIVGEHVSADRLGEDERGQRVRLHGTRHDYGVLDISLLGQHQTINCATAVAALEASGLTLGIEPMRAGLANARWPGRFQIVRRQPTVVLDGAHNAAAAEKLALTAREHFAAQPRTLILGILRDKNCEEMCAILAPLAERILCVPVPSERTGDPHDLARWCRHANPLAEVSVAGNLSDAYARAASRPDDAILITGSLFLVGEALGRLGFASVGTPATEKELILQ
jgi:dihydrofolate synthase/folylpolyglutamate synthase